MGGANLVYLPALSPTDVQQTQFARGIMTRWGFAHNFLSRDKSLVYYPFFLMSAHYGRSMPEMRKDYNLQDCFILGDSGGFQNVTLNANLDPLEVLRWQEDNCTAGLILDHPPFEKIEGSAMFGRATDATFRNSLEDTKRNAIIALTNRRKSIPFKLYGVIQGDTEKRKEEWFAEMRKIEAQHGEFDGWALSPKPSYDIKEIAQHAVIILTNKIAKPIHILQITGFETMAMAAFIASKHPSIVTVDSSSFSMGRRYFIYQDPMSVTGKFHIGENKDIELAANPCDCPVCQKYPWSALSDTYEQGEKTIPGVLISMHNMYQTIRYAKYLNAIKNDPVAFRKFAKNNFGENFLSVMDYIEDALIVGHDKAWRRHIIKTKSLTEWTNPQPEAAAPEVLVTVDGEEEMVTKEELEEIGNRVNTRIMELKKEYPDVSDDILAKLYEHKFGEDMQWKPR